MRQRKRSNVGDKSDSKMIYAAARARWKRLRTARTTNRIIRMMSNTAITTTTAAMTGCCVASQVSETATTSSPKLKAMLENGSGDGVTAALIAVLPLCDAKAIVPPSSAAASCVPGDMCCVAP